MSRKGWYICGAVLVAALSLLGLRLWVAHRIEISLAQPVICLTARDRANIAAGHLSTESRDFLVVKNAQFGNDAPPGPTPSWPVKGLFINLGYDLLWSERSRAAEFARLEPHMRDCPRSSDTRPRP